VVGHTSSFGQDYRIDTAGKMSVDIQGGPKK